MPIFLDKVEPLFTTKEVEVVTGNTRKSNLLTSSQVLFEAHETESHSKRFTCFKSNHLKRTFQRSL